MDTLRIIQQAAVLGPNALRKLLIGLAQQGEIPLTWVRHIEDGSPCKLGDMPTADPLVPPLGICVREQGNLRAMFAEIPQDLRRALMPLSETGLAILLQQGGDPQDLLERGLATPELLAAVGY